MEVNVKGVVFTLDETKSGPPLFVLSVRKSGSTMLNSAMRRLAKFNDVNFVDVGGTMFRHDIPAGQWSQDVELGHILCRGNAYGGFRNFPSGLAQHELFAAGLKVLLVRDPRDALVSEYFSNAYSHKLPDAQSGETGARERLLTQRSAALEASIEDYVSKRAPAMARTIAEYGGLLSDKNTLLLKYEDVIFDKQKMILDIAKHFGWTCQPRQMQAIVEAIDIRPTEERPKEFVRRVTPGDHLEKLSAKTIARINSQMGDVLGRFGY